MIFSVNILPLIIGGLFNMVLGALWYSKVLFAKPWMEESGVTDEQMSDTTGMGQVYGLTLLMAVVTSYVIGFIVTNLGLVNFGQSILLAMVLWIGTDLPMIIKNWGFESRSLKLGFINHSYQLVVYIVVGILFILF